MDQTWKNVTLFDVEIVKGTENIGRNNGSVHDAIFFRIRPRMNDKTDDKIN